MIGGVRNVILHRMVQESLCKEMTFDFDEMREKVMQTSEGKGFQAKERAKATVLRCG